LCDVYHHVEYPPAYLETLRRALKPGGRMVVIDFERIEGVTSERMMKHVRAGKEVFSREIIEAGFSLDAEVEMMEENYVLRFVLAQP
jgi:predicted methyltransferase